jgi:EF-P beta-lysylation protein EpmB
MSTALPMWRKIQKENFHHLKDLAHFLELSVDQQNTLLNTPSFPLNLPRRLAAKIQKKTLDDPLLKQFVALKEEASITEGFCPQPTQDELFSQTPQLLKKYEKRALLVTTSACAMHCRFCFRKNYPYDNKNKSFEKELALLAEDSSLVEVILSGGDPLSLSDAQLKHLIQNIEAIRHIKILRFHSRFPIGIPERITEDFLQILKNTSLQVIFITHINHPLELDSEVVESLKKIQCLGIPMLNQTVLLKGINDSLETLIELNLVLIRSGVIPYYLHQLDKVQGCAHFEVDRDKGIMFCEQLRDHLPGYAVPRYVEEIPGKKSKFSIF